MECTWYFAKIFNIAYNENRNFDEDLNFKNGSTKP